VLRDEIEEYRQPDGLITPDSERDGMEAPDTTGNGLLYASLYYILLVRRNESIPDDVNSFEDVVHPAYTAVPGILNRSATKIGDQTGRDDYVGVVAASRYLKTKDAYIILNAGNRRRFLIFKWFYQNGPHVWKSWMGRYPTFITFLQWVGGDAVGGVTPNFLRILCTSADMFISWALRSRSATSVIIRWLQVDAILGRHWLTDTACSLWMDFIGKDGMRQALEEHLGKDHPIARYWV
jgi:hypothetical protein